MQDPQTKEEWQEVVDLAHALLVCDSAHQYGLITGGPEVNVERCEQLLKEGKARGFEPAEDAIERFSWSYQK